MELRRANSSDADAVAQIFLAARREMTYLPSLHTDAEVRRFVADLLLVDAELWVAELDGSVAGFVALGAATVEHLYVDPAAQRRGVGARLLELAQERRPDGLELWVFQRNDGALRFYERHGFRVVRTTDGAANEEREPDALLAWRPQ